MKIVRFLLLTFALTFFGAYSASSAFPTSIKTIWSVTKSDRGLFGYNDVAWELALGGSSGNQKGWVGDCSKPGWERCKPPRGSTNTGGLDLNDEQAVDYLLVEAELRIANGSRAGYHTYPVQVQGESFTRIYKITWSASEILRRPTEHIGNGQTITMEVQREDVEL